MTTLTGIRDAQYLAQFLGKKIAVRDRDDPKKYYLFPTLWSIQANGFAYVKDKQGDEYLYPFGWFENPYVLIESDVEIVIV